MVRAGNCYFVEKWCVESFMQTIRGDFSTLIVPFFASWFMARLFLKPHVTMQFHETCGGTEGNVVFRIVNGSKLPPKTNTHRNSLLRTGLHGPSHISRIAVCRVWLYKWTPKKRMRITTLQKQVELGGSVCKSYHA